MTKALIAPMTLAGLEGPHLDILHQAGFETVFPPSAHQLNEEELLKQLDGVTVSVAGSEPYTARVLDAHPQLKIIARVGVGYDAVDIPAATERGVAVTIAPGTNQEAVAEGAFALMLALAKNIVTRHLEVRAGTWPRQANLPLRKRTLGIVGLGRIGKAVAERGKVFGMNMLAYEPYPDEQFAKDHGVKLVSLEEVLSQSDYITLHLPLSAETKYLINKDSLKLMKSTAFLVNTARGGLVCEADLYEALKNGTIAGAGLDVLEHEPPGMIPLFELDNTVFAPHTAGMDVQSRDDMALSAAQAIVDLTQGKWPSEKIVNSDVRDKFKV